MKKTLILIAFLFPAILSAQQVDTTNVDPEKYVPQLGYFQKAHRDASDPRFMITDESKNFSLGVGGMVHINTFYDVRGAMSGYLFSPGTISIPSDKTSNFGYTATGSDIYLKARASKGKAHLTAYLEMAGAEVEGTDYVLLNQAYISVNGLTVGKVYSFFMDLEAGPLTVDLQGPNTQIAAIHNLIGYTLPMGKHWTAAASLETPQAISKYYQVYGVSTTYNKIPDFAAHLKYRGEKGHIQAGVMLREVSYWASNEGFSTNDRGMNKYAKGFGLSLSGNYNPSEKFSFSAQYTYGKGVSDYIQDLAELELDLGMEEELDKNNLCTLSPLTASGGYASVSYRWSEKMSSSAVYGFCDLNNNGLYTANPFKHSDYCAANLFYFFTPACFLGIEYLYGRKVIYAENGADDRGHANRINACICYKF